MGEDPDGFPGNRWGAIARTSSFLVNATRAGSPRSAHSLENQMTLDKITQGVFLDYNAFTPIVRFNHATATDDYRKGNPYQLLGQPGRSEAILRFMVPPPVRGYAQGKMYLRLNHCRTTANGVVDMLLNGKSYRAGYADAPRDNFGVQTFEIPYSALQMTEPNEFVIRLANGSPGVYWLSDVTFAFEDAQQCLVFAQTDHVSGEHTGSVYEHVTVTDDYRRGRPYLLFNQRNSSCRIVFFVPETMKDLDGTLTLALNHCSTSARGVVDMVLNRNVYRSRYADAPWANFGVQEFEIPFGSLNLTGPNVFDIELHTTSAQFAFYWLSDARLTFAATPPAVTHDNYERYVKDWILAQRRNIQELDQVPRDDLSAWQFIQDAPSWFYLPWLPLSPTELGVLIRNFPTSFITVGFGVRELNAQARAFHEELIQSDLPRKNALRHAYWTALMTRQYGAKFAVELSDAHEYAHVDLTIEGPFDHVTDKINNAVGIELARNNPSVDCGQLIDQAWKDGKLAWVKNVRQEGAVQTADVGWQAPLDALARDFDVIPDFSSSELATLQRMGITVPSKQPIHDEL